MFKKEWLLKLNETEILFSKHRQNIKIGDILIHRETNDVVCSICYEANTLSSPVVKWGTCGNWTN
jgi:hypothetical protein